LRARIILARHLISVCHCCHAHIDCVPELSWHDVGCRAAADRADIKHYAAPIIGHPLDGDGLTASLEDSVATFRMPTAGMRKSPARHEIEDADAFTRSYDFAAIARRFADEHILYLFGKGLDQRP
jgi:hypothetical protein